MSSGNAKKSFRNAASGLIGQMVTIIFGFYVPRLVIIGLGSESNGLISSVGNIISYLSLLEAGIGAASLQALYAPFSCADTNAISGIMTATKQFYRKTGLYYGIAVIGAAIVYPLIVHSSIPVFTVISVILLSGLPNVINFYFQGKYILLLRADGKSYIFTNVQTVTHLIINIGKVVLLNLGFGLIALQLLYCAVAILQMTVIEAYVHKNYRWLNLKVNPNLEPLKQRHSVLVHEISRLIFNSTDSLILSVICGLKTTSIYAVYTMLISTIGNAMNSVSDSVNFYMGQMYHKDRNQFLKLYSAFEVYNITASFALFTIANIFILPFLNLYTAGAEISYIDSGLPWLFIAPYLLKAFRTAPMNAIIYAGHFKQTRWHAVGEMVINLIVSIGGAYWFGIYGVLFGTIAALIFRANIMIYYGCKKVLHIGMWHTYWIFGSNLTLFVFATIVSKIMLKFIKLNSYFAIVFWAVLACLFWTPIFFVVESILNKNDFEYVRPFLLNRMQKILKCV